MFIKVNVTPGSKKESIEHVKDRTYKVLLKEPAEQGRANKRLKEVVAEYWQCPLSKVRLLSGHHQPSKMLEVDVDRSE